MVCQGEEPVVQPHPWLSSMSLFTKVIQRAHQDDHCTGHDRYLSLCQRPCVRSRRIAEEKHVNRTVRCSCLPLPAEPCVRADRDQGNSDNKRLSEKLSGAWSLMASRGQKSGLKSRPAIRGETPLHWKKFEGGDTAVQDASEGSGRRFCARFCPRAVHELDGPNLRNVVMVA